MKKQYVPIKEYCDEKLRLWQERLGLSHYHIEIAYLDSFYGDDSQEDFKVTAVAESRPSYLMAKIKIYLPSAIRHDFDELERVLVHELCHVLLSPEQALIDSRIDVAGQGTSNDEYTELQNRYMDQLELTTEMTCRAILKAYGLSY